MKDIFNENDQDIINMLYYKYNNDKNYRKSIEKKYDNDYQKLTWYELYVLEELTNYGHKNYLNNSNEKYDNSINYKCDTPEELKDTLFNIFVGNDIYEFLKKSNNPRLKEIFERQKNGLIAHSDKEYLINVIKPYIIEEYQLYKEQVNKAFSRITLSKEIRDKDFLKSFVLHDTNIDVKEIGISMNNNYVYKVIKKKVGDKNE